MGVLDNPYRGHRFPSEIISECVWQYFRFGVSFRDVEEMMLSSIFWFNRSGTALPQFVSFASFYGQLGADRASLLRISCGVTGRRNGSSCLASRIDSIATSITGRRTLINRRASGRGECVGSNPVGTPSGLSKCMESLLRTSALDATCSPPLSTDNVATNDSGFGIK